MFSHPGHLIGDAWYFVEGDTAHMYYLTAPDTIPDNERHMHWDIGHAVSLDLTNWRYVGIALEKGRAGEWDDRNLATGSVIRRGDTYWMAYTGHRAGEHPDFQRVGMAFSQDLETWQKAPENPVTEPDADLYELASSGARTVVHWRDPFMLTMADEVYHVVCARGLAGDPSVRGCVGLASTVDMRHWRILPPIESDPVADELEVPQVYAIGGLYYLVFCCHPNMLAPAFTQRFPDHSFRSADYCMVAESPMGPFRIHGSGEVLPGDFEPHLYASQLVQWQGDWYLLGTVFGGDAISDPIRIQADEQGLRPAL